MKNNAPDISIIIIVKNDTEVFKTLKSLRSSIDKSKNEIIIVDASDETINSKNIKESYIKWINFKSKSKKKITIPEQRNIGVNNAQGKIVVFIDANCLPAKNWLTELTKDIMAKKENIVAGSIFSSTSDKHHDLRNALLDGKKYLFEAPTMNLAVNKDVFNKIGYFDETFDYGSDVDFTMRATEKGFKIKYNPKAAVYHNWGTIKDELKRAFSYGEARVNIYRNHKKNIITIFREDSITIIYPLFILFLPIALIYPWYIFLPVIPLIKNWRNYPFKNFVLNLTYGVGILYKLFFSK